MLLGKVTSDLMKKVVCELSTGERKGPSTGRAKIRRITPCVCDSGTGCKEVKEEGQEGLASWAQEFESHSKKEQGEIAEVL